MTRTAPNPPLTTDPSPRAERVPESLRVSAAERLVSGPDRTRAAMQLVANAPAHGIDLNLLWGVQGEHQGSGFIRQVVMGVPSAGRTGMLFLSEPRVERRFGTADEQSAELTASLAAANAALPTTSRKPVRICQALIEPEHTWADRACRDAGMTWVGRLSFLRKPFNVERNAESPTAWPAGVTVERVRDPQDFGANGSGAALERALEGSYEDTLDCPELCGLRSTRDVIASHMATGSFDPNRWWLLRVNGAPEGCCLLNHCPATFSIELVYLGISPRARGMGLGTRLLAHALSRVNAANVREITCAVDTRNEPALKLYHAQGFRAFSARVGFVHVSPSEIVEVKPRATQRERAASGVEIKPQRDPATSTTGKDTGTSRGQENLDGPKRL